MFLVLHKTHQNIQRAFRLARMLGISALLGSLGFQDPRAPHVVVVCSVVCFQLQIFRGSEEAVLKSWDL